MPVLKKAYYLVKPIIPRRFADRHAAASCTIKLRTDGHAWPIDEKAGGHPKNWPGWPDRKRFAFVMTHDVETEVGRDRCLALMRLDQEYGSSLPSISSRNGMRCRRNYGSTSCAMDRDRDS